MVSSPAHNDRSESDLADQILRFVGVVNIALVVLLTVVVLVVLFPVGLFESSMLAPLVFTLLLAIVFVAAGRFGRRRSRPVIGEH
jgi:membrane protein YdbS with pleckstrin-like domain